MMMAWCARCAWGPTEPPAEAKRHLVSHCRKLNEGYDVVLVSDQEHEPQHASSTALHASASLEKEEVIDLDDGEGGPSHSVTLQTQSFLTPYILIKANMENGQERKEDGVQIEMDSPA
eukprot:1157810-Pelagomonas_calceolata.AAC.3